MQSDCFLFLLFPFLAENYAALHHATLTETRTHPLVLLFGPRPFDELRVENLLPPVLALHICAILAGRSTKRFTITTSSCKNILTNKKDIRTLTQTLQQNQLCSLSCCYLLIVSLQLVSSLLIHEAPQVSSTSHPGNRNSLSEKQVEPTNFELDIYHFDKTIAMALVVREAINIDGWIF